MNTQWNDLGEMSMLALRKHEQNNCKETAAHKL